MKRKRKRSACIYRNSDGIPTDKTSSSKFPRNFVKSPNGSPTAIIFPRNSSVFSEEHSFPRNFLGIFRRTVVSSKFRRYIPRKFRGNPILCFLGISSKIPRYRCTTDWCYSGGSPPGFPPLFLELSEEDQRMAIQYVTHSDDTERRARIARVRQSIEATPKV
ncbi:hypothetical protein YC2023_014676 [Brassica napus]